MSIPLPDVARLTGRMRVVRSRPEVRTWVEEQRREGARVALVPTMGALHAGHLSLVEAARRGADRIALSIYVNPLQFGPGEDYARYPRELEQDLALAAGAGVDLVFAPAGAEVYPAGEPWVMVVPHRGADRLCGALRPDHFRGVLTVVAKLFGIFGPDTAVFGQKDFQQLVLIRHMTAELEMGVRILAVPTVREPDGLALSSRNRYLSSEARRRALALPRALADCEALFAAGERDADVYRARLGRAAGAGVAIEYGEVVDPETLDPLKRIRAGAVCAIAARVGDTRLIDNVILGSAS